MIFTPTGPQSWRADSCGLPFADVEIEKGQSSPFVYLSVKHADGPHKGYGLGTRDRLLVTNCLALHLHKEMRDLVARVEMAEAQLDLGGN